MKALVPLALLLPIFLALPARAEKTTDDGEQSIPEMARAATINVSLVGQETYNRIFTSDVDPTCQATSSLSLPGMNVPYVVFHVFTSNPQGENLVCAINPSGTDVIDTVISLYCLPFDPNQPEQNLVAYDDDGGMGLLSAFTQSDGVFLEPFQDYCLVLSIFDPSSLGGGQLRVDFAGDVGVVQIDYVPILGPWGMTALIVSLATIGALLMRRRKLS